MADRIEVKQGFAAVDGLFASLDTLFEDMEKYFAQLKIKLEDERWQGEANEECKDILEVIHVYEQKIRPLCNQAQADAKKLMEFAESFAADSVKLAVITGW